jgi:transposase
MADKFGGTIKAEIKLGPQWPEFRARAFALRRSLGEALTLTQRQLYPQAIDALDAERRGVRDRSTWSWVDLVEPTLRHHWNQVLQRNGAYFREQYEKDLLRYEKAQGLFEKERAIFEKKRSRGLDVQAPVAPKKPEAPHESAYAPIYEALTAETAGNIKVRWTGDPRKELLANRVSIPSWKTGCAFFIRSRVCRVSGDAKNAAVELDSFWPGRSIQVGVAPVGNGHRALWRRLVKDSEAREKLVERRDMLKKEALRVAADQGIAKDDRRAWVSAASEDEQRKAARALAEANGVPKGERSDWVETYMRAHRAVWAAQFHAIQNAVREAEDAVDNFPGMKLGKVGITYDEDKRKWFALVTYTAPLDPPKEDGIKAAVNLGVHVAFRAVSEEGATYKIDGHQIIAIRRQFQARRKVEAEARKADGRGSTGHGYNRKLKPLRRLQEAESNFIKTWIQQQASRIIDWCAEKNITTLFLEDYTDARDNFEKKTGGEAHEEVKRFIHNFPHYQWRQAVERAGLRGGRKLVRTDNGKKTRGSQRIPVKVVVQTFTLQSQKCPCCGHTDPANTKLVPTGFDRTKVESVNGGLVTWQHLAKETRFSCVACGRTGDGDLIAAVNNLVAAGCQNPGHHVLYLAGEKNDGEELVREAVVAFGNGASHQPEQTL